MDDEESNSNTTNAFQTEEAERSISQLDQEYQIVDLENKIFKLEAKVLELQTKNNTLQLEISTNNSYSIAKRLSFHPKHRSFTISSLEAEPNSDLLTQISELTKEKNELQEISDKMLNILTEKEIENRRLTETIDSMEEEHEFQLKELSFQLEEMKEVYEELKEKAYDESDYNSQLKEYNEYKERTEAQEKDYYERESNLNKENEDLTLTIHQLNSEMQRLELDNFHLINSSIRNNEFNMEQRQSETSFFSSTLDQIKGELALSKESNELLQIKFDAIVTQKDIAIQSLNDKNEALIKRLAECNDDYFNKLDSIENQNKTLLKELNTLKTRINDIQKQKNDLNKKNKEYKLLIDKKTQELKDINISVVALKKQKDNEINQLEDQYNRLNQSYLTLIEDNKRLAIELNANSLFNNSNDSESGSLERLMKSQAIVNENIELKKEITTLKTQLGKRDDDITSYKSIIDDYTKLKNENEVLKEQRDTMSNTFENQFRTSKRCSIKMSNDLVIQKKRTLNYKRQCSAISEISTNRQITQLNLMRENDKKYYLEQLDRLKTEISELKVKLATQSFEKDSLIVKYRNIINTIAVQCKKKGISINMNLR